MNNMKHKILMTLALLITAVGGAWAADTYTVAGNNAAMFGSAWDPSYTANDMTKNGDGTYSITYTNVYLTEDVQYKVVKDHSWSEAYPNDNRVINIAEAGTYTLTIHFNPTTHEVYETMPGSEPADVEVTTNAASEQDLFTEAWFNMPASDVTVNYELVRDMQDETNPVAFSGLPSSGNIVVKKRSDGKYQPAEALTIQLIDPLAAAEAQNIIAADGITIKVLLGAENGQGAIDYDQENPITLEAFLADMKPGYYWIKAESTDENSPYDGTVYSSQFTAVEQYDLTVKPANDFSKGKIESVTVGSGSVTIDANTGEATKTGIAPDTEVKIKAKRGYVIEKVEVKKTMKLLTLTIGDVTIYYAEGDSWANAISRDENKDSGLFIREGNRVHHTNYGQLVDSNTEAVLPVAIINANESYRFIK